MKTKTLAAIFIISAFLTFPLAFSNAEEGSGRLVEETTSENIEAPEAKETQTGETSTATENTGENIVIDEIGMAVATMNLVLLHRGPQAVEMAMMDKIQAKDAFETGEWSRLKMLLLDGSTVTLDANTKMSLDEFSYSDGSGGKTAYTLYEGFLRLIAGKTVSTIFTDEAVISLENGSVEVIAGIENQRPFTGIACLDGKATVTARDSEDTVTLERHQIVTVLGGEPIMVPLIMPVTGIRAMGEEEISDFKESKRLERIDKDIEKAISFETALPPFEQEPRVTTPVTIRVEFQ